jgi:hypothetical protein
VTAARFYECLPDPEDARRGPLRVVDESGDAMLLDGGAPARHGRAGAAVRPTGPTPTVQWWLGVFLVVLNLAIDAFVFVRRPRRAP